ncbi:hypothetical protein H0H92_001132 [Tricholoma furcatifolium]|nr:hypothetical protein H0H92_001132 [Tricholoma furcatifolium]
MLATFALILLLGILELVSGDQCGTVSTPEKIAAIQKDFLEKKAARLGPRGQFDINVYFHNVYEDETKEGGYIEDDVIDQQMTVLRTAFSDLSITLNLVNTTHTQNADWFTKTDKENAEEYSMAVELRQGGRAGLNIYTIKLNPDRFGYATWPADYDEYPERDGVYINFATVPGGDLEDFNLGQTLSHEAGHWVGLLHTFAGTDPETGEPDGCFEPGDEVDDTPYEKSGTKGCPAERDSCPDLPGDDPIRELPYYNHIEIELPTAFFSR